MISLDRLVNFFGCWYTVPYPSFGKACRLLPLLLISAFCGNLGRSSAELVVLKEEKLFLLQSLEDLVPQHMGSCLAAYWWARKKKRALPRPCKKKPGTLWIFLLWGLAQTSDTKLLSVVLVCLFSLLLKIAWQNIPCNSWPIFQNPVPCFYSSLLCLQSLHSSCFHFSKSRSSA